MKIRVLVCLLLAVSCSPRTELHTVASMGITQPGDKASKIAAFCVLNSGRRVGNGECWTLADEAFKSAGAKRPGSDLRVWGRLVNPSSELLKPGDVMEFESARFDDGVITGPAHTAVVVKEGSLEKFSIAEQNWGRRNVRIREMNLKFLAEGIVKVYRPG